MWSETSSSYRNRRRYLFLLGQARSHIYETPMEAEEDMATRIAAGRETMQKSSGVIERVCRNMGRRCNACHEVRGQTSN
jgi:hypothetical protein